MSDLKATFEQAQKDVKTLTEKPSNQDLLRLYSLFKQATEGDVSGKRPGALKLVERAKFDAWAALAGTGRDEAMKRYVDVVKELLAG